MGSLRVFFERLRARPVIAGLRHSEELEQAVNSGVSVVFILGDDIFALQASVAKAHAQGRLVLAHLDLIRGIGRDEAGVQYLARALGVDGVLTTRTPLITAAKKEGLIAVQRLFALDSESLKVGLPTVEKAAADAVEILPGVILPIIAERLVNRGLLPPLIAGGLIRTEAQVDAIMNAGALAVSTSAKSLWSYTPAKRPHGRR